MALMILSTADYDASVWTNKQHLATRLAESRNVIYVESLGLRMPTFQLSDLQRIVRRLSPRSVSHGTQRPLPENLDIVRPRVLPFHKFSVARQINRRLLARQVARVLGGQPGPHTLWTFSPITYGIESQFDSVVYHSVDFLHELRGLPTEQLLNGEKDLLRAADSVVASSIPIKNHLLLQGAQDVLLWENVADTEIFLKQPPGVARQAGVVFAGNLSVEKINFDLLRSIAKTGVRLTLAGPMSIDGTDTSSELRGLLQHENVKYLGNLEPGALAEVLNSHTVGIIPYALNKYTEGVFPMKVYEYMASGLRVVSTPLPSLSETNSENLFTRDTPDFVHTVLENLDTNETQVAGCKAESTAHSWTTRTLQAQRLLESETLD